MTTTTERISYHAVYFPLECSSIRVPSAANCLQALKAVGTSVSSLPTTVQHGASAVSFRA
ncbi:hypothetical protein SCLCIDRAFT_1222286 [Scleroderma citrinum Foug A]|uniref:Uncharacterized protein n=1 Tax=Scleroderma citrinum Foug A TaxID=1036808 RepID=A0A0C3DCC9_9AGAM|nr:hypothetical protein SCLCIDRAFT_1222286 [Scleroderma citrinum Foug A]